MKTAGFSLVEVLLAIVVTSVGVLGAAGVVLGIGAQALRAARGTERTLAGRNAVESLVRAGHAVAISHTSTVDIGGRRFDVSHDVTEHPPRLKHARVTVSRPPAPAAELDIVLARPRPLPAAP
ncbi:MAG: prepilin-type N-terminal cleavage/methylation domain-containing protein [Gemmatimonadota bacterium]|uniref:type IV pilus modification PilV family protein n=1 Tax=Candidatus Palauibacter scopulicola TaxID=3056741 RepID=UPI002382C882|nr:prepilin-type N-terminal cleavage/methylation domain-containing protein [Candidatus Palauibacter scopulicola]MDE2663180.1 prepilin-type N-terminal cleavage/methylation domain-containing protein [Candidatus Palauibacter scopulicola]